LFHGAGTEDGEGDAGVGDGEGQRHVGQAETGLLGDLDELLDDVDAPLVAHMAEEGRAAQVAVLTLTRPPGEQAWASGLHTSAPIPYRRATGRTSRSMPRSRIE
jgi:hypothetical protein